MLFKILWAMYPPALAHLHALFEKAEASQIGAGPASDAQRAGLPVRVVNQVAVIPIVGTMFKRAGAWASWYGLVSTDLVTAAVRAAVADSEIESILLAVDSPGGSVDGLAELADAIYEARQVKPVVAHVDGMACSAAYYTASQASKVVATRDSLIGSIGVRILLYDQSRFFENEGIEPVVIDTGEFKSVGVPGTVITEEHKADLQRMADNYFLDFLEAIKRGRPRLTDEKLLPLSDGKVYQADKDALERGLIDGLGTQAETLGNLVDGAQQKKKKSRTRMAACTAVMRMKNTLRNINPGG